MLPRMRSVDKLTDCQLWTHRVRKEAAQKKLPEKVQTRAVLGKNRN